MRVGKNEALYRYMLEAAPALVEDDQLSPGNAVLSFPQKAPDGAIYRTESADDLLERVRRFNLEWVRPGHREGVNTHNVSCTISIKPDEWAATGEWMWNNRDDYNGIAVLPYDGGTYPQAPFTDCTEGEYLEMLPHLEGLDLTLVREERDETDLKAEAACAGGQCEIV